MSGDPSGAGDPQQRPRHAVPLWVAVLIGCLSATVAAVAVLAVDRPRRAPVVAWLSDFFQSSGFAGLCAVLAAVLALRGIHKQVWVTRRGQVHRREADEDRAWWERFEWTAARAVPASSDEVPLPYDAVISTLTALMKSAKDDIQRTAVSAVMDVAAQAIPGSAEGAELTDGDVQAADRRQRALHQYSVTAGDSPARSIAVDWQLYEFEVLDALERILPSARILTRPRYRDDASMRTVSPDAVVEYAGKRLVVEIKYYSKAQSLLSRVLNQLEALVQVSGAEGAVLVAPVEIQKASRPGRNLFGAIWASPHDDEALRTAILRAAGQ